MIANIDSIMDSPRPLMPHVIPIPGLFVKEPHPLNDAELLEFMNTAENGVIVSLLIGFVYQNT